MEKIYYERRFLRCDEYIIPIVRMSKWDPNSFDPRERDFPLFRDWTIFEFENHGKVLFTIEELKDLISRPVFDKPIRKSFDKYHVNFQKWMLDGIPKARTIYETLFMRNDIYVHFKENDGRRFNMAVKSAAEIYHMLNECKEITDVTYGGAYDVHKNICVNFDTSHGFYVLKSLIEQDWYVVDDKDTTLLIMYAKKFKTYDAADKYKRATFGINSRLEYEVEFISPDEIERWSKHA